MKKLFEYDVGEYIHSQFEYWRENKEDCPYGEYKDDDELKQAIYDDYDLSTWHWEDVKEALSEIMKEKQQKYDGEYWKAKVNNFGWRNLSGEKYFKAETAEELLRCILPNCECTFHAFNWRNGICIRNWHHDSPTGNEHYYIVPIQYSTYERGCSIT